MKNVSASSRQEERRIPGQKYCLTPEEIDDALETQFQARLNREKRLAAITEQIRTDPKWEEPGTHGLKKSPTDIAYIVNRVRQYRRRHPEASWEDTWQNVENDYKKAERLRKAWWK